MSHPRKLQIQQLERRHLLASVWQNELNVLDVNDDCIVSPLDVLINVNQINSNGSRQLPQMRPGSDPFYDTNGDGYLSPIDVLWVVNELNRDPNQVQQCRAIFIPLGDLSGGSFFSVANSVSTNSPQSIENDTAGVLCDTRRSTEDVRGRVPARNNGSV